MSRSLPSKIAGKLSWAARELANKQRVKRNTHHISGRKNITLEDDQVAMISLLKNAAYYIDHMIAHHRSLGVSHFIFIDNGSTDGTRERLATYDDVTVFLNTLPVNKYECLLRADIARMAVTGGWFLFVDSDELIMFPRGEGRHISEFAAYCNSNGYDGVIGHFLDLFPLQSLKESAKWDYTRSIEEFHQYSLQNIKYCDYYSEDTFCAWFLKDNVLSNDEIKFMLGGIRNEVFGEICGQTHHRFIRNLGHIDLYSHPHCSGNLSCADFPLLIKHYKFANDFWERQVAQMINPDWDHNEAELRMSVLEGKDDFVISGREQHRFSGTEPLISQGFLSCSDRYLSQFPRLVPDHKTS